MKNAILQLILMSVFFVSGSATATEWYVDDSVAESGDGTSPARAFEKIQEGINAASDGDTVIVAEGTYIENVNFSGKSITLRGADPLDPAIVAATIIDGNEAGSVVTLSGTETELCVLSGFTLRNGSATHGGGICGGKADTHAKAGICHNVISGNAAQFGGGGIYACDGIIHNNRIIGNSGGFVSGGGLCECNGPIRSNLVVINRAGLSGGGLSDCNGEITNNTITGNSGGGIDPTGGLASCQGTNRNCNIWDNPSLTGLQLFDSSTPRYSCIEDWEGGGEGNIRDDPLFEETSFRLSQDSPCIDAGLTMDWMPQALDLDGNLRVVRGDSSLTVDMGAYEYRSWAFRVTEIRKTAGKTHLTWASRPGDVYRVRWCTDLVNGAWVVEPAIASHGQSTTWTDSDTLFTRKFYRIGAD